MTPVHDLEVRHAPSRLQAAETQMAQTRGTAAALPAWLRMMHWSRLRRVQVIDLHWFYLRTETAWICTCGLTRGQAADPGTVPGHLDTRTWQPTDLLLIPAPGGHAVIGRSPASPVTARSAAPRYQVVCQRCDWRSSGLPRAAATAVRAGHTAAGSHLTSPESE